jgi:A/G-specific adenine glycosylase
MGSASKSFLTKNLLLWNENSNQRTMPWKGEKNPYLIWLSEIILQQTRVEQGLPYFAAFKKKYPTVQKLANAPQDEVMKLWQGLGYYSRARNLHFTAKYIAENLNGIFPDNFQSLQQLKGVGAYTAAAIASFAFDEPVAVVDGNVIRILSRYFGIETPFDTTDGKKEFGALAQQLISTKNPAAYNQAIMDFGATVCTPQNPDCNNCILNKNCFAFEKNLVALLPVRSKKLVKKERHFCYTIIHQKNQTFIRLRTAKDIWKELYEFPLIESDKPFGKNIEQNLTDFLATNNFQITHRSEIIKQLLTHQKLHITFIEVEVDSAQAFDAEKKFIRVAKNKLKQFAFPKTIAEYLQNWDEGRKGTRDGC